jgi:hypothetical protein
VEVLATLVERATTTLHMADYNGDLPVHECCRRSIVSTDCLGVLQCLVDRGGVGTLAARNIDGALPLHVLCGASTTIASLPLVQFLMQSCPGSVAIRTDAGEFPFMIAASNSSLASLSVVYELVRANPLLAVPP